MNQSIENFLNITNSPLERYAPLTQVTKKDMKTQSKPWITKGIVTSIRKKAKIHSKLLKVKDQTRKEALNTSLQDVLKTSSRRLQDVLEDVKLLR